MNINFGSIAGMIGKTGVVSVSVSCKGAWKVEGVVKDVRISFGRADYLVAPVAPSEGEAVWIDCVRFSEGGAK